MMILTLSLTLCYYLNQLLCAHFCLHFRHHCFCLHLFPHQLSQPPPHSLPPSLITFSSDPLFHSNNLPLTPTLTSSSLSLSQAKPMVCVALEPLTHQDLPKLEEGLKSLYQVSSYKIKCCLKRTLKQTTKIF